MKMNSKVRKGMAVGLLAACAAATGCSTTIPVDRFAEPDFASCTASAMQQVEQAEAGASAALYHVAASSLDFCAGLDSPAGDPEKQMQVRALATINYFKSGDLASAQKSLDEFRFNYPRADLYFNDGTAFTENMALLLGELPVSAASQGSLVNAKVLLKSEVRRADYWRNH